MVLTTAALAAPAILSLGTGARAETSVDALYAAAKNEGKLVWWCGHLDRPAMEAVRAAFIATYPGIAVDAIWQTGEVVYTRIQQDLKAGVDEVDVFGTSNAGHWSAIKKQNALVPYLPTGAPALAKLFRDVDPDNTYRAAGVEVVIIDYRSDKVNPPPAKWADFVDPQWDNKLTFGSPSFSGDVANWTVAMLDKYGKPYLTELSKRNPKIGRSILGTGTDLLSGERLVGHGVDANTFLLKSQGNPIDVNSPMTTRSSRWVYTGVLKNAPHPNAARLFMEFNDSKEYSVAMAKVCRFPIRADVPSFSGLSLDTLKTYKSSPERLAAGTPEAIAAWRSIMGI
ncbi:MAG: extracellular solute-binding protein [Acetobacteraceae bacterium]